MSREQDPADRLAELGFGPSAGDPHRREAALRKYQTFHGLEVTGVLSRETERSLAEPRFCGFPDVMPMVTEEFKWPQAEITWAVSNPDQFTGIDGDSVIKAFSHAFAAWARVCNIQPRMVTSVSQALVRIECAAIDGTSRTLAWSELANQTNAPKQQRYDSGEQWVFVEGNQVPRYRIDLGRVAMHEIGHVIGIPHINAGNLMQSMYDQNIWMPKSGDIAEAVRRYGPPVAPPPPPPPPAGSGWVIQIEGTGSIAKVLVPGFRVTSMIQE